VILIAFLEQGLLLEKMVSLNKKRSVIEVVRENVLDSLLTLLMRDKDVLNRLKDSPHRK